MSPSQSHTRHAITLQGVSMSFGSALALRPTDLTVHRGEFLTLLGPSGEHASEPDRRGDCPDRRAHPAG